MASKFKAFMVDALKVDEIREIEGTETFLGDDGKPVPWKLKRLSREEIADIRKMYTTRKPMLDKRGKPIATQNGDAVMIFNRDEDKVLDRMIIEAFVFPDFHDADLMAFYGVNTTEELLAKLLRNSSDYKHAVNAIVEMLGAVGELEDDEEKKTVDDIKN